MRKVRRFKILNHNSLRSLRNFSATSAVNGFQLLTQSTALQNFLERTCILYWFT